MHDIVVGMTWFEPVGSFLRNVFPYVLAVVVVVLAVVAAWRRRWAALVVAAVLGVTTVLTATGLRILLPRPGEGPGLSGESMVNTYPSGHVAATAALVVALILLWPRALPRGSVAVAIVVVLAAALGSVATHAHRPSDVVGGVLLVCALAGLLIAAAGPRRVRPTAERVRERAVRDA
ncbi:phosphatase PAP2 family protein [Isoptericola aurantiacus]|uniref:phosphatase PAP2 family protein n=1 Tax=Isoptericola aurantiacus TaxID=3377839 RepID=UPI00383AA9FC